MKNTDALKLDISKSTATKIYFLRNLFTAKKIKTKKYV